MADRHLDTHSASPENLMGTPWITTAKSRRIGEIAGLLGMDVRRDRCGPCPACNAEREGKIRRLPVGLTRGDAWICNACRVVGDGIDLVAWRLTGGPSKKLDVEGWRTVRGWFAGSVVAPNPTRIVQSGPDYPPPTEVAALWRRLTPLPLRGVTPASQPEPMAVVRWLRSRALDPELVATLDAVRIAPAERPGRLQEGERAVRAPGWPWCAAMPLVDATGLLRSLVFRAVEPPEVGPKSYALAGYERRGLVLADPVGIALLARTSTNKPEPVILTDGGAPAIWDGRVILVEGEPDLLSYAVHAQRMSADLHTYAVLGWLGSGGLPAEIAVRIPAEAQVLVVPHRDQAGEQAALRTRERLKHVRDVRKVNV